MSANLGKPAVVTDTPASDDPGMVARIAGADLIGEGVHHSLVLREGATYLTAQTGTTLVTPSAGKKLIVIAYYVTTLSTVAGRVILWFGAASDTVYSEGTDDDIIDANLTPTTQATPGVVAARCYEPAPAADFPLKVTSVNDIQFRVGVKYYEVNV